MMVFCWLFERRCWLLAGGWAPFPWSMFVRCSGDLISETPFACLFTTWNNYLNVPSLDPILWYARGALPVSMASSWGYLTLMCRIWKLGNSSIKETSIGSNPFWTARGCLESWSLCYRKDRRELLLISDNWTGWPYLSLGADPLNWALPHASLSQI